MIERKYHWLDISIIDLGKYQLSGKVSMNGLEVSIIDLGKYQ